jgi:protein NDRG1
MERIDSETRLAATRQHSNNMECIDSETRLAASTELDSSNISTTTCSVTATTTTVTSPPTMQMQTVKRPTVFDLPKDTYKLKCPKSGDLTVVVQGNRGSNEVCVLTAHDLGCNWNEFNTFMHQPTMLAIASRIVWIHLVAPGQEEDAPDLPADFKYPSLQDIADDISTVLDQLNISSVVLFGDGAGANILLRYALKKEERVLGAVLVNATAAAAGFVETHREKAVIGRRLSKSGMTTAIEQRLATHRFGANAKAGDELDASVERYCEYLRTKINQKNLALYTNAYYDRTNITNMLDRLRCQLLLISGSKSDHSHTVHTLHATFLRTFKDDSEHRRLIEFLRVDGVVSVMHEKPEKLAECLQYFLQGLGLLSGLALLTTTSSITPIVDAQPRIVPAKLKVRSLSMVDYDRPKGISTLMFNPQRKYTDANMAP